MLTILSTNKMLSNNKMSMSCNICCENFKTTRPKICCQYCDFEACRTCCEKYILSEEIPKCMMSECGREWSRKFIKEHFTSTFVSNAFKEHIESILFDKEKALLPATQPIVEEKKRVKKITDQMHQIDIQIRDLQIYRNQLKHSLYNNNAVKKDENARTFVRQCPANGCRGFLSTQWKCGLCEKWACPDCHEVKGYNRDCEHTCDPNSVQTAKLLSKDSKPCPNCQSLIFKINGCQQIWCTQCRTAFNWKTGKIETGLIHNPHYYEWQRTNGGANGVVQRNPHDIQCGQELTNGLSLNILNLAKKHCSLYNNITYDHRILRITTIIRNMVHNMRVELRTFNIDHFAKNQELRIKYLTEEIDEKQFKILIQRADKKHRKNTEIYQTIVLCNIATTDIIYRFHDYLSKCPILSEYKPEEYNFIGFMLELNKLQEYCNGIFKDIAFTYNCIQYRFTSEFVFQTIIEKEPKFESIKKESV